MPDDHNLVERFESFERTSFEFSIYDINDPRNIKIVTILANDIRTTFQDIIRMTGFMQSDEVHIKLTKVIGEQDFADCEPYEYEFIFTKSSYGVGVTYEESLDDWISPVKSENAWQTIVPLELYMKAHSKFLTNFILKRVRKGGKKYIRIFGFMRYNDILSAGADTVAIIPILSVNIRLSLLEIYSIDSALVAAEALYKGQLLTLTNNNNEIYTKTIRALEIIKNEKEQSETYIEAFIEQAPDEKI